MTASVLDTIVAAASRAAAAREARTDRASIEAAIARRPPDGQRFRDSITKPGIRVIAECKRRSPSKGILRSEYDPARIAHGYAEAGAAAISVLTEPTFFDGALDHLRRVRARVGTPLLCKDFVVSPYQVVEAAACGADAVLLIVAALDDATLGGLIERARSLGLATLVEVHDASELTRAIDAGADIVGVNSRNLRTLEVDPGVLETLGAGIPAGLAAVAESGLRTAADLSRLHAGRYDAFLIGERLMTEADPGAALHALLRDAHAGVPAP